MPAGYAGPLSCGAAAVGVRQVPGRPGAEPLPAARRLAGRAGRRRAPRRRAAYGRSAASGAGRGPATTGHPDGECGRARCPGSRRAPDARTPPLWGASARRVDPVGRSLAEQGRARRSCAGSWGRLRRRRVPAAGRVWSTATRVRQGRGTPVETLEAYTCRRWTTQDGPHPNRRTGRDPVAQAEGPSTPTVPLPLCCAAASAGRRDTDCPAGDQPVSSVSVLRRFGDAARRRRPGRRVEGRRAPGDRRRRTWATGRSGEFHRRADRVRASRSDRWASEPARATTPPSGR